MDYNNEPPKVVFGGEEFQQPQSFQTSPPKIIEMVIKYSGGYIKDEKQASYVLVGFAAVMVVISLFLFSSGGSEPKPPVPSIDGTPVEKTYQGQLP